MYYFYMMFVVVETFPPRFVRRLMTGGTTGRRQRPNWDSSCGEYGVESRLNRSLGFGSNGLVGRANPTSRNVP